MARSHLVGILRKAATLLGLRGGATNYKEMMHHHVLEVGLDDESLLA